MKNEKGSIVVWLLVGVLLLAALSVVMMQGSRTSQVSLTSEEAKTYAKMIIAQGEEVKATIKRMQFRGVKDTDFDFGNTVYGRMDGNLLNSPNHNPNCLTDTCRVFSVSGGGLQPSMINSTAYAVYDPAMQAPGSTFMIKGSWFPMYASLHGVGTPVSELVYYNAYIKREVCMAINDLLGIPNPNNRPPSFTAGSGAFYLSGAPFPTYTPALNEIPILHGKTAFCYTLAGGNEHNFYNYAIALIIH